MSIPSIAGIGFTPYVAPTLPTTSTTGVTSTSATSSSSGVRFGDLLGDGIDRLQGLHGTADTLAVQAATGDLQNLHDYTIAATEASVATQLTVAVRNKAVESFNEIMRMAI